MTTVSGGIHFNLVSLLKFRRAAPAVVCRLRPYELEVRSRDRSDINIVLTEIIVKGVDC